MFSEYLSARAVSPPISFWTATSALHIDWLNAMSLIALGITTAMRKGAANALPARTATSRQAITNRFPLIPSLLSALDSRAFSSRPTAALVDSERRSALTPLERLVERRRLAHAVDRHGERDDRQDVRQHHGDTRGDLHPQDLDPELERIDHAEKEGA